MMLGLNIVDPGHNVEKVMKQGVARFLENAFAKQQFATTVCISKVHTDPFTFV
jgi:putative NIF3 family GTP cyclohydrolase 1 type 2